MSPVHQQYAELLALTQLFLLQEHAPAERILADSDSYHYFREYALRKAALAQPQETLAKASAAPSTIPPTRPPIQAQAPQPIPAPAPLPAKNSPPQVIAAPPTRPTPAPVVTAPTQVPAPAQATQIIPKPVQKPVTPPTAAPNVPAGIFTLEIPAAATPPDLKEMHALMQMHFPGLQLLENPPHDQTAKQAARVWEKEHLVPEVTILSFEEDPKQKAFLGNLGKALEAHGISAAVVNAAKIEQEKAWLRLLETPGARLVIAGGYGIYTLSDLMQHYSEGEKSSTPRLGRIPLLILSDIALYLKEPTLKPSLWKSLKELLSIA